MPEIKRALVLTGGNVKGAFQAGAIKTVIDSGFRPDAIFGVSVGALNGAFLADQLGRTPAATWPTAVDNLELFWRDQITSFSSIGKVRSKVKVIAKVIGGGFNGLLKMKRLDRLVDRLLKEQHIANSPVPVFPGIVELNNGEYFYATTHPDWAQPSEDKQTEIRLIKGDFLDYVLASTREPVKMPVVMKMRKTLVDGGIRNIAPLKSAIDAKAIEIITISNQPEKVSPQTGKSYRNFFNLIDRTVSIMTNEIVNNDLQLAHKINMACIKYGVKTNQFKIADGPLAGNRYVESTIIRPETSLGINVLKFNTKDIKGMITKGKAAGMAGLVARDKFRIDIGYTPPQN